MATRLFAVVTLLALMVGGVGAQDARAVLQAVAKNIGADTVKTIQISGAGFNAAPGQSFSPTEDWPRFEVTSYTKVIDYDARFSREQTTRRQGTYPARGGGGTPIQGDQRQDFILSGNYAWNRLFAFNPDVVRDAVFETVNQKYVLSDGTRTLDLYPVQGLGHAAAMLVVYLPKEKILVNADLYSPPVPGGPPPASNPNMVALNQTIQRLRLDVAQHLPIHGRVGTHDEFVKIIGQPATN